MLLELTDTTPLLAGETRSYTVVLSSDDDVWTYVNQAEIAVDDGDDVDWCLAISMLIRLLTENPWRCRY